jgi:hypothetical protein
MWFAISEFRYRLGIICLHRIAGRHFIPRSRTSKSSDKRILIHKTRQKSPHFKKDQVYLQTSAPRSVTALSEREKFLQKRILLRLASDRQFPPILPRRSQDLTTPNYLSNPHPSLRSTSLPPKTLKKDEGPNPQLPNLRPQILQTLPSSVSPTPSGRRTRTNRSRPQPLIYQKHSSPIRLARYENPHAGIRTAGITGECT